MAHPNAAIYNKRYYEKQKAKGKLPLSGFPWAGKFQTMAEVDNYLSGSTVQCLLCGRWFKMLGIHLTMFHSVSSDDYQSQFGIPWTKHLVSKDYSNQLSEQAKADIENADRIKELASIYQPLSRTAKHRPLCEATHNAFVDRNVRLNAEGIIGRHLWKK